jgi:hypothetical protein
MAFVGRGAAVLVSVLATCACGGLGSDPPQLPPVIKYADGRVVHIIDRGSVKAFYDQWGRLVRIEQDTNGDGKADRIARHDGEKWAHRLELDLDFDGEMDRWEDYGADGKMKRYAIVDSDGRVRLWVSVNEEGKPLRYEYDKDADGKIERAEVVVEGRIGRIELDTNRDGKADRWQDWREGRLRTETIDLDGDGRPDRRLLYGPHGITVERIQP